MKQNSPNGVEQGASSDTLRWDELDSRVGGHFLPRRVSNWPIQKGSEQPYCKKYTSLVTLPETQILPVSKRKIEQIQISGKKELNDKDWII